MAKARGDLKFCPWCKDTKSLTEFYKNRGTVDGLTTHCKPCNRVINKRTVDRRLENGQVTPIEKVCTKCNTLKPKDSYYSNKKWTTDGLQSWCKECIKKSRKDYYNRDIEKLRKKGRDDRKKEKLALINAYGGKCVCCGESQWEFLTIDHINNDGAEHRRRLGKGIKSKGSTTMVWRYLRKNGYPKGEFQLLCFNCNCAKGFFGYCPHTKEDNK